MLIIIDRDAKKPNRSEYDRLLRLQSLCNSVHIKISEQAFTILQSNLFRLVEEEPRIKAAYNIATMEELVDTVSQEAALLRKREGSPEAGDVSEGNIEILEGFCAQQRLEIEQDRQRLRQPRDM